MPKNKNNFAHIFCTPGQNYSQKFHQLYLVGKIKAYKRKCEWEWTRFIACILSLCMQWDKKIKRGLFALFIKRKQFSLNTYQTYKIAINIMLLKKEKKRKKKGKK